MVSFSLCPSLTDSSCLIERAFHSGILSPGPSWITLRHSGATALILYRIRVMCDANYYDTTCTKYCKPRDDIFGHYTCDSSGLKICKDGWMGEACQTGKKEYWMEIIGSISLN